MKKFIMGSTLLFAALLGANTANAQIDYINVAPQGKKSATCQPCNQPCGSNQCGPRGKACFNPFAGITLTEQQKTQIEALSKEHKSRADRQQPQAPGTYRKERLDKIKSILTPEQYVQYLENCYLQSGKPGPKIGKDGKRFDKKGNRHDKKRDDKKK